MPSNTDVDAISESGVEKWHAPMLRAGRALLEWLAHIVVVVGLLVGIRLVEEVIHRLWNQSDRLLFGKLPLGYIFDAADLAVLVGFLTYGVFCVIAAYMRKS